MSMKSQGRVFHQERSDRMISRARHLFTDLAERHLLKLEWDETSPVELAACLHRQAGLDWSLWLNLQNNDEIGVQSEFFYVEWFPADDPAREAEFIQAVDGILSGSVRLVCNFGRRGDRPYSVHFELETAHGWKYISGYANGIHIGRPAGVMILQNGHEVVRMGRAVEIPVPT